MYSLIKCGKLYDGIKDELQANVEILVEGKRIKAVGKNLSVPEGTQVYDLSGSTVTPGMIDAHMHMDYFSWQTLQDDTTLYSESWRTLAVVHCAQRTLARGFTSVRNIGCLSGSGFGVIEARKAIEKGYFEGSRMVVAPHCLGTSGSHGDASQRFALNYKLANYMESIFEGLGNGADFFRAAVRQEVKAGADLIKIMGTGGFFTPNDSPEDEQLTDEELKAIMETAIQLRRTVTAHAYTSRYIQKLVSFGIHGIEHGSLLDEKGAEAMEKNNVYLVPTFSPYDEIVNLDEENLAKKPKEFQEKLRYYAQGLIDGRKTIINSKIKLGYGSDFVAVHNNYESGYEYASWLRSGVDPFRALKAATATNAEILNLPEVGRIKAGMLADIAAWNRDLLTDEKALLDCAFVMKDGKVYPTETCE